MSEEPAIYAQSTRHILMMEPVEFYSNPETMATNAYQSENPDEKTALQKAALDEFRAFRDLLVAHGVIVTTVIGQADCPDDLYPNNWISTHQNRQIVLYPMLHQNRRKERRAHLIHALHPYYRNILDLTDYEDRDIALESTGALCMDRVNKVAYTARSPRADVQAAQKWAEEMNYELVPFETEHRGMPVYHTDVVMWIGSDVAGVCSECLKDRAVIERLSRTREVVEFTNDQMAAFCGNALEVLGRGGERMLTMSAQGYGLLDDSQKEKLGRHYETIIQPEIPTIEKFGGGSARCMMLEMF